MWGTLLRPAAKMLAHAGHDTVKESLWPFALSQACQIHNSLPTRGHTPPTAPLSLLTSKPVDLSNFRVMFCDAYCSINDHEIPTKISSVRVKCTYLGWSAYHQAAIVYIPSIKRITQTVDIDYNERSFTMLAPPSDPIKQRQPPTPKFAPAASAAASPVNLRLRPRVRLNLVEPEAPADAPADAGAADADAANFASVGDGSKADCAADAFLPAVDADLLFAAVSDAAHVHRSSTMGELYVSDPGVVGRIPVPTTAKEALSDPIYKEQWRAAMDSEVQGKYKTNSAWKYVKHIPAGRKMMKGK